MATATYLVFTRSYGILRKRDDNIRAARTWAKRALGTEAVSVVREHHGGTSVALSVPARVTYTDGRGGTLHMAFVDCVANVMKDGQKVGEVSGCIGGGIEITRVGDSRTFYIEPADLWHAFDAAVPMERT